MQRENTVQKHDSWQAVSPTSDLAVFNEKLYCTLD